jgi:predicted Zn-dependent protease
MMIKTTIAKICLLLLCLLPAGVFAQASSLPEMGSSSGRTLSPTEERTLGEIIMQDIYRHLPLIEDPFALQYIQRLGDQLAATSNVQGQTYTFFIVNASSINAFALPGGFIGVHTGLILQSRNESELAGVISHEMAHVNQHHIARMFEKAKQMNIPTMAALLGAIAVSAANPALGSSLIAGTMAGAQQMAINFTRHNEEEADRVGIDMLAKAGFDPNGMSNFFERMQQANRYNMGEGVPEFLRTHPMTTNRMADAQNRAQHYATPPPRDEKPYRLIKERVRNFTAKPNSLTAYYKNLPVNDEIAVYGHALTETHDKKYNDALNLFKQLLTKEPESILYQMGKAEVLAQQKDYVSAEKIALRLYKDYPYNLALLIELCDFYLSAQRPREARDILKTALKRRSGMAVLYSLLARAYVDLRDEKNALISQADYFAARWNYEAAIRQLEMAKKAEPVNDYETAILDAKKKKLEAALAQQKKLEKAL